MYLMLCDTPVIYFDFEEFIVQEINPDLVPFGIRGAFHAENSTKAIFHNVQLLKDWFSSRVLSFTRDNSKQIYALFGIPQVDDTETRVNMCIACNGVSVSDSYWIKKEDSDKRYCEINIRQNRFHEIIDVSLYGIYPSFTVECNCPELTTHGMFGKAWTRENDGLYLLKTDRFTNNINTRMEVLASEVIGCFYNRIKSITYKGNEVEVNKGKIYVDRCKNFAREAYSFVEAYDVKRYFERKNMNFREWFGYTEEASSIGVLDFIIANTDRHLQNYGFFMDNKTGKLSGFAPIFDFNLALVSDCLNVDASVTLSQMFNDGSTILEVAEDYLPHTALVLDEKKFNLLQANYMEYDKVFQRIKERCKYLGITKQ